MVRFINKLTGSVMMVDDARKEEYIDLGHKMAPEDVSVPEDAPKKPSRRKTPVKKGK